MANMATLPRETSIKDLQASIARALAASNQLAEYIAQLRINIAEGKPLPEKKVDLMEQSNRDITRDVVSRVEQIENSPTVDAKNIDMLQALNARLAVCDLQAMRLAELRDVELSSRSTKQNSSHKTSNTGIAEPEEQLAAIGKPRDGHLVKQLGERGSDSASEAYHGDDEQAKSQDSEASEEVDGSDWPLLYRMLDVDPNTMARDIEPLFKKSYKRLALKHSPQFFPNDPEAPARWEKISKAYDILVDYDKRMFYHAHGNTPAELERFDLATLKERR